MSTVHVPELRWLQIEVQIKAGACISKQLNTITSRFGFLVDHETFKMIASQTYGTSIIPLKRYILKYLRFLKKIKKFFSINECSVHSLLKICRRSFCPLLISPKKVCLTS
jgi:hypothetical protein